MKKLFLTLLTFLVFVSVTQAKPPFIEHGNGFFDETVLLKACLAKGKTTFNDLNITVKKSTNPKNEVVGFQGDYKVVLYCVSDEGGCDAPEDAYASGITIIVAGSEYTKAAQLVKDVQKKMKVQ
jgi:hypothetical protein